MNKFVKFYREGVESSVRTLTGKEDYQFGDVTRKVAQGLHIMKTVDQTVFVPDGTLEDPEVVIVGGGPVGLWTAIITKLRRPVSKIMVLERYEEYKRNHTLILNSMSLPTDLWVNAEDRRGYEEFIHLLESLNKKVKVIDLENKLKNLAEKIGIFIKIFKVEDTSQIFKDYPTAKIIIGADGSHSLVRETHFQISFRKTIQPVVQVKYDIVGEGKPLNLLTQKFPTLKLMGFGLDEHIGRMNEGVTTITLMIFVDPSTSEKLKEASFKNPYTFSNSSQMDEALLNSIKIWMRSKQHFNGEKMIPDSEKITTFDLASYASDQVYKKENGVHLYLVGDAAFGVPYFRSLNNGLLCGTELSKEVASLLNGSDGSLVRYNDYALGLCWMELKNASLKGSLVKSAYSIVEYGKNSPDWAQVVKFDQETKRILLHGTERDKTEEQPLIRF
eukprot:TRINITY_DN14984_c0_g1_i1.p1 TRINITY_DN14984_c0_g1~~TRINITY_DN14984_c0_g1_i1.p1  ORF type:complete len:444 (+),score=117.26 TRINITY_DN14984_c0_g1_i1:251-1582(+)